MKKTDKKHKDAAHGRSAARLDWSPVWDALDDMLEWALDIGVDRARDDGEVEAIENVRDFLRASIDGEAASLRIDDFVFTLGTVLSALERDLGFGGVVDVLVAQLARDLGAGRMSVAPRVMRTPARPRQPTSDLLERAFAAARARSGMPTTYFPAA